MPWVNLSLLISFAALCGGVYLVYYRLFRPVRQGKQHTDAAAPGQAETAVRVPPCSQVDDGISAFVRRRAATTAAGAFHRVGIRFRLRLRRADAGIPAAAAVPAAAAIPAAVLTAAGAAPAASLAATAVLTAAGVPAIAGAAAAAARTFGASAVWCGHRLAPVEIVVLHTAVDHVFVTHGVCSQALACISHC